LPERKHKRAFVRYASNRTLQAIFRGHSLKNYHDLSYKWRIDREAKFGGLPPAHKLGSLKILVLSLH